MRALLIGALLLVAGCAQKGPRELKAITAPGGAVTAHWLGVPPTLDKDEPAPRLEHGVKSLYFSFAGDARRHPFKPLGTLYFSDWSFDIFSPDGAWVALLESHYGPVDVIATGRLREFLAGAPPDRRIEPPVSPPSGAVPVVNGVRWISSAELELDLGTDVPSKQRYPIGAGPGHGPQ